MATNPEEPNMEYEPLEDPNASSTNRRFSGRATKVLLAASGLLALAAIVFVTYTAAPDADSIELKKIPAIPHKQLLKEVRVIPSDLAQVTTVRALNKLLLSSIVADHKSMYDAMPDSQFEALLNDFLSTIGSQVPDSSGTVTQPSKSYRTANERKHRLSVFRKNVLKILQQNADEYVRKPRSDRLRFGLTVHADWTEEEFLTTRLNLRATDMPAYIAANKIPVHKAEAAKVKATSKFKADNRTKLNSRMKEECQTDTGGSCMLFSCHKSRAAQCYEHRCLCVDGSCAVDGRCAAQGCDSDTGGTCSWFSCSSSRGADCVNGKCLCPPTQCAQNGACVPAPQPSPSPTPSNDDTGITCSEAYSGPVRNQGSCGDCWAFSTAQQLRYMTLAKYEKDPGTMSVQYLVDCMPEVQGKSCSDGVKGCCGGLPYRADVWLAQSGGLPTQADYGPLHSDKHPFQEYHCKGDTPKTVTPSGNINVYQTEKDIANGLCAAGPVSIAINANAALQSYIGGILDVDACPPDGINHAVLYVGVDKTFDDGDPVHIVLNSWGPDWGVGVERPYESGGVAGHVLFKYGENVCNIAALASQPDDISLN